jgi:hypothetical protein
VSGNTLLILFADMIDPTASKESQGFDENTPSWGARDSMPRGRLLLFHIVPALVATVLLLAAAGKAYQVASGRTSGSVWLVCGLVQLEVLFGLLLLVRLWPRLTHVGTLVLFTIFMGVSLQHLVSGDVSCGCFGDVPFRPIYALALDLMAFVGLWVWRPSATGAEPPTLGTYHGRLFLVLFSLAVFPALGWFSSQLRFPRLAVEPRVVEVGTVRQGQRLTMEFTVRNPHDHRVLIDSMNASCPCLEVASQRWVIHPAEDAPMVFVLDLGKDPGFVGNLLIEIEGLTPSGETAFLGWVRVTVVSR